ncbi:hypothetical protein Bca52824_017724 [Brassica carinata]|uniref:Uncharacterized protein n=1 Tax=Brassica carinata TaxID=52824 RepID=A0A8X8AXP2_BRACI|nr:hypothetical protein Bca52824_017724 [Brassica carinata]
MTVRGSPSDTWNYWLIVKEKTIWWKDLYELDQAARVFPKKKDKTKVEFAKGLSSNSVLESNLKGPEERLLEFMREAFVSLNLTLETKLESIDLRMSKMEKNPRLLKKMAKKIEERLTSIESKVSEEKNQGEDMDFGQWDHEDYGTKAEYKDNSDNGQQEGSEQEENAKLNQLKERCIVEADELWRKIEESEDQEKV